MPKREKRAMRRENALLRELVESYRIQMAVRRELDKHRIEYIDWLASQGHAHGHDHGGG